VPPEAKKNEGNGAVPMSDVKDRIREMIEKNKVVLFMKGTKSFPQCGFSNAVVQVLKREGVPFETVNVLTDPEIREGIKEFSNWPTIPQLYVAGKFLGGCDIVTEMHESGELAKELAASGAKSN
jgi:monothiol glutaredoxin